MDGDVRRYPKTRPLFSSLPSQDYNRETKRHQKSSGMSDLSPHTLRHVASERGIFHSRWDVLILFIYCAVLQACHQAHWRYGTIPPIDTYIHSHYIAVPVPCPDELEMVVTKASGIEILVTPWLVIQRMSGHSSQMLWPLNKTLNLHCLDCVLQLWMQVIFG